MFDRQYPTHRLVIAGPDAGLTRRLCRLFELDGLQVHTAVNVAQARSCITGLQPRVVLAPRSWKKDISKVVDPTNTHMLFLEDHQPVGASWPRVLRSDSESFSATPGNRMELLSAVHEALKKRVGANSPADQQHAREKHLVLVSNLTQALWQTDALEEEFDLRETGQTILDRMADMMEAGGGSFFICGETQLELVHSLDSKHVPDTLSRPLRSNSPFQKALFEGRPLLIDDVENERLLEKSGYGGYENNSLLVLPVVDADGKVAALASLHNKMQPPFTQDDLEIGSIITRMLRERFTAAEVLRQSRANENRYRTIFESSPDAMFVKDSEGHYLQVNSAMETLCALPRRQIIGRRADDILGSKIGRQIEEQEKQVLREARTVRREMTINPGAECRVVVLTVVPVFGKDARPIGVSGFARDISSRRQLEDQLRQSQKMEALGQLAGGVAHDFNNLLQTILAHAQFAERHMDDPESSREDLRTILRASESAAALTKQLLTFGRRQEIEARVVDLYEVVDDLMKMVRRVIGEDIDLAILPRPDDLRYVMADTGQLEQILMNLSVNARDAMPEGGRIAIAFQNATISPEWCEDNPWAKPGHYVMLSFSDNGIGMNEETTRYLFEPFFTTKKEGEGTGLGLSTVYGIVQQHKGLIDVHSREGEGSRFDIYLPAHQKAPEEVVEPQPGEATSIEGSETVLVAEDEVIVRELVERLLEDAGYEVILTSDGQEAVEKFQERHEDIDLVILDAVMPRLSGYAAYCKMHEIDPDVPIFFCSGYAADSLVSSSQTNLPLPPVIQKPYRPIELLKMVRRRIDENKKAASELS